MADNTEHRGMELVQRNDKYINCGEKYGQKREGSSKTKTELLLVVSSGSKTFGLQDYFLITRRVYTLELPQRQ